MASFEITVTETIIATYKTVTIEAATREDAVDIAEEMRCEGTLGDPEEDVEDVDFDALWVPTPQA